jgi:hypothetical protein
LVFGKAGNENGNQEDVVDPKYQLKSNQQKESSPYVGVSKKFHGGKIEELGLWR